MSTYSCAATIAPSNLRLSQRHISALERLSDSITIEPNREEGGYYLYAEEWNEEGQSYPLVGTSRALYPDWFLNMFGHIESDGAEIIIDHDDPEISIVDVLSNIRADLGRDYIFVQGSLTCSRMAPDSHGGFAILITEDNVQTLYTSDLLHAWKER